MTDMSGGLIFGSCNSTLEVCCKCGNSCSLEARKWLDCSRILGTEDGNLPLGLFFVCSTSCHRWFDSGKLQRLPQQDAVRQMRRYLLKTEIEVGDVVETSHDYSATRWVEKTQGTVVERRYDWTNRCAELSVKCLLSGHHFKVWPAGVKKIEEDENVGARPRRVLEETPRREVLSTLFQIFLPLR